MRLFLILFSLLTGLSGYAQTQFEPKQLQKPARYGPQVASKLKQHLVYEYKVTPGKHVVYLKNGLRSSSFVDPARWKAIRDTVFPYRVDIVYSRYPVHDSVYHEIYPLLCNRLIHLFELDPELNTPDISWNTVLQTHCESDDQVNRLFHGIVIWYRTPEEEARLNASESDSSGFPPKVQIEKGAQGSFSDYQSSIESAKNSDLLSDSVRRSLENKPLDEQNSIIRKHLESRLSVADAKPLKERSAQEMYMYKRQVTEFIKNNPIYDSVVWKVMDRHPEWSNALVINDWTGSMYGYGAQIIQWHLYNYKNSGIRYVTLFNDGDKKNSASKVIGETGGIYSSDASDINKIINLFNLVRLNGNGGDRAENDIEAILEAINRYPEFNEIILIADNFACIRDIELAEKIKKPVKILVCGYMEQFGINPHLVYLAKVTNGGLYTLEKDLENIKTDVISNGELKDFKDRRFMVSMLNCKPASYEINYGKEVFKIYDNLDSAILNKINVRHLVLTQKGYTEAPKAIRKMENLVYLDLSHNELTKTGKGITKLAYLKELNLSGNNLKELPSGFKNLKSLEVLDISNNEIENISHILPEYYYLSRLKADHNAISDITGINYLKNCKSINLGSNGIAELPLEINQLKKLVVLDLSDNKLVNVPKTIVGLIKLEELNLSNNSLGSLPPYLYRLRKLKVLNLSGNPISEKEKERIRKELPLVEIIF